MKRFGPPVPTPPTKEVPGPGWKVSKETMEEIQEIEDNSKRAEAMLAYCWHWYV